MTITDPAPRRGTRAPALSIDDRRSMILDVAIPLMIEHGQGLTTKQVAEAAGIAEGTLFRAFGDKDAIIDAAVARFLDPAPLRKALSEIDPDLELEQKVRDILFHLRSRFAGVIGIMSAAGMRHARGEHPSPADFSEFVADTLCSEAERLRFDPLTSAYLIRLIAFGSSISHFDPAHPLSTDELAHFVVHGIAAAGHADHGAARGAARGTAYDPAHGTLHDPAHDALHQPHTHSAASAAPTDRTQH